MEDKSIIVGLGPSLPGTEPQVAKEKEVASSGPVPNLLGEDQKVSRATKGLVDSHAGLLSDFLELSDAERDKKLQDGATRMKLLAVIRQADVKAIVNPTKGHTLFLELAASSYASVRQLAYRCLWAGANPQAASLDLATALHYAAQNNDAKLACRMLRAGLSLADETGTGKTPIHLAVEGQNAEVARALLDNGQGLPDITDKSVWLRLLLLLDPNTDRTAELAQTVFSKIPNLNLKFQDKTLLEHLAERDKWSKLAEQVVMERVRRGEALDLQDPVDQDAIEQALGGILSRPLKDSREVKFVQRVLAMPSAGLISVCVNGDQGAESLLGALIRHPNLPKEIRTVCDDLADAEIIEALDKTAHLSETFITSDQSWLALGLLVEGMRKPLEVFERRQVTFCRPLCKMLNEEWIPLYKKTKAKLEAFLKKAEQNPSLLDDRESILGEDAVYFDGYLVYRGRADLATHYWKDKIELDVAVSSLLLDKMGRNRGDEGSFITLAAASMADVLEKLFANSAGEAALEGIKSGLTSETLPLIKQCALFSISCQPDVAEFYSQKMGNKISRLKIGEKILLPTGSAHHTTLLLIERTGDKAFRLTHYNTGEGIDPGHRLKGTNKNQTYTVIEGVPLENLTSEALWRQFFRLRSTAEDMAPFNAFFIEEIGKGGRCLPPSTSVEDYEDSQRQGTCTFQCVMAFLRHQIMEKAPGTKQEKLAVYKLIKAKMLLLYAKRRLHKVGSDSQAMLQTPIAKLKGEIKLAEIAHNDRDYRIASEKFGQFLKTVGKQELVEKLAAANRPLQRYALLREASVIKANYWIQQQNAPKVPMPSESLAKARYEHRFEMERRHRELFRGLPTLVDRCEFLIDLIAESSIPSLGFTLTVQCLDLTNEEGKAGLKAMVEERRVHHPDHIASLAKAYRSKGLDDAALFVEETANATTK